MKRNDSPKSLRIQVSSHKTLFPFKSEAIGMPYALPTCLASSRSSTTNPKRRRSCGCKGKTIVARVRRRSTLTLLDEAQGLVWARFFTDQ
ncbi:hypothetical protein E2542_SST24919 [Spatholobus suberectus]|nr:hypothetical protein E2542_SST24919 [Spatholobus suberectus]